MTHPSVPWRLLMRVERYLPWWAPASPKDSAAETSHMIGRGRRRWTVFAAMLPMTLISLLHLVQGRADLAEGWPVWRPMVLDITLLIAGAVLAAGVAFGVHAWRKGADA